MNIKTYLVLISILGIVYSQPFTISTVKKAYILAEPLYLEIESPNNMPTSLESHLIWLEVVYPNGKRSKYIPPVHVDLVDGASRIGVAGNTEISFATITISSRRLVFNTPGNYELCLISATDSTLILSNKLQICFGNPITNSDVAAHKLIQENEYEYGLFVYLEAGEHLKKGFNIICKLAETPSTYQSYARFVLSTNYTEAYCEISTGKVRDVNLVDALKYNQSNNKNLPDNIRIINALKMIKSLDKMPNKVVFKNENEIINRAIADVASGVQLNDWDKYRELIQSR